MGGKSLGRVEAEDVVVVLERALPVVYDYLLRRVRDPQTAQDLTSETLLGAYGTVLRTGLTTVTVAWLIGVARHKLTDHWRAVEREQRRFDAVAGGGRHEVWEGHIETGRAEEVLAELSPSHRAALTLRYLDGLSVSEVADLLGRSVGGTEVLLVRAKQAFRERYATPERRTG